MRSRTWQCGVQQTTWHWSPLKQRNSSLTSRRTEPNLPHSRGLCGKGSHLQIPDNPHIWGLLLVCKHHHSLKKGTATTTIPESTEENRLEKKFLVVFYWDRTGILCGTLAAQQQYREFFKGSTTLYKESLTILCPLWKTSPAPPVASAEPKTF